MDAQMMVGKGDVLSFEDMREEERAIVQTLEAAHKSGQNVLKIADIMSANGWDKAEPHLCGAPALECPICDEAALRGNSKVRNNLRRLRRYGVIARPAEGQYQLVVEEKPVVIEPVKPTMPGTPRELNDQENRLVHFIQTTDDPKTWKLALKMLDNVKRADCSFYGACLDQAIDGGWEGFSCADCTAYAMVDDYDQRVSDVLALRACQTASDELEEFGKVNRVRGVKPGADAKRTA